MLPAPPAAAAPIPRTRSATRAMAQARTRKLAELAGRGSLALTHARAEQTRRELTGETDMSRREAVLDTPVRADGPPSQTVAAVSAWENEGGQPEPTRPLNANG